MQNEKALSPSSLHAFLSKLPEAQTVRVVSHTIQQSQFSVLSPNKFQTYVYLQSGIVMFRTTLLKAATLGIKGMFRRQRQSAEVQPDNTASLEGNETPNCENTHKYTRRVLLGLRSNLKRLLLFHFDYKKVWKSQKHRNSKMVREGRTVLCVMTLHGGYITTYLQKPKNAQHRK